MTVRCFLPCRKGSERIPRKNIKPFAGFPFGLIEIKLSQLLAAQEIDEIVLSTNDEEILEFAGRLNDSRLRLHRRADALSSSGTRTDELVAHALELIPDGHILWTHVTSPFVLAADYDAVIRRYRDALQEGYDSLMTTTLIHGFLWNASQPLNYDRHKEKWPRTQTLEPVHEVNSAVFLSSANLYRELDDRIGRQPLLYPLGKTKAFDIDWMDDFAIAESIVGSGVVEL